MSGTTQQRRGRLNVKVLLLGLLLVIPLVVLFAKSFDFDPAYVDSPLIGKTAPNFTLRSLDGETITLAELRGDPVVINFWASYCPPCVTEHPTFLAAADHYRGRVHFLGIVFQDSEENIRAFNRRLGQWGPTLLDPEGKVAIAYGIYGPPETFLIDGEGIVRKKVISAVQPRELQETLDAML